MKKSMARGMICGTTSQIPRIPLAFSWTHSFLQVFTDLVVNLQLLIQCFQLFLVDVTALEVVHRRWLRRLEEVEERVRGDNLLDDSRSVGVFDEEIRKGTSTLWKTLTLVTLLLDLHSLGQVLVLLPLDLVADGLVVNEFTSVANVFL